MADLQWKKDYEIGDDMIDGQHRQLLEFANLLYLAVETDESDDIVNKAFDGLFAYTKKHFTDEEIYFKSIDSAVLAKHRAEHRKLEGEVTALWQDEMLGFREGILRDLENWVETRLVPHMTTADQEAKLAAAKP